MVFQGLVKLGIAPCGNDTSQNFPTLLRGGGREGMNTRFSSNLLPPLLDKVVTPWLFLFRVRSHVSASTYGQVTATAPDNCQHIVAICTGNIAAGVLALGGWEIRYQKVPTSAPSIKFHELQNWFVFNFQLSMPVGWATAWKCKLRPQLLWIHKHVMLSWTSAKLAEPGLVSQSCWTANLGRRGQS